MKRHQRSFSVLMLLSVLAMLSIGTSSAVEYHVTAIMQLTGSEVSNSQSDQWRAVASLAEEEIASDWADLDTLSVHVVDTAGSKNAAIEAALLAVSDPSVMGVVTAGLSDKLVEEVSRLLRFSNVRFSSSQTSWRSGFENCFLY
jgi:hypothetical protein